MLIKNVFKILAALVLPVAAYQGGSLTTHNHTSNSQGGLLNSPTISGTITAATITASGYVTVAGSVTAANITVSSSAAIADIDVSSHANIGTISTNGSGNTIYAARLSSGLVIDNGGGVDATFFKGSGIGLTNVPYTVNVTTTIFDMASYSFTNTAFDGACITGPSTSTVTNVLASSKGIKCEAQVTVYPTVGAAYISFAVLMDGSIYPQGSSMGKGSSSLFIGTANQVSTTYFAAFFPYPGAGSHRFCIKARTSANTGNTYCQISASTDMSICSLECKEVP